jgi:uncharacterized protein (DUF305 family)
MNKATIVPGLVGVLIGIIFAYLLTPWWGGMMGYRNSMRNAVDPHFIEQMIPHHDDAILMADLALTKATHPEIKELAQDIKRTQSEEISQMRTWYKTWYGKDVPDVFSGTRHGMGSGMMHMGMMGDATDIERLKTAADFDQAFIEEMIPHHQMAVMMAQMLAATTNRPEMKQLAQNIIDAQTHEINSMRTWYQQWYGQK